MKKKKEGVYKPNQKHLFTYPHIFSSILYRFMVHFRLKYIRFEEEPQVFLN